MEHILQILQLPERCLVKKKITKAFFKRNFDMSLGERKTLDDASVILQIEWLASLKPEQINIPSHSNAQEVYEEIQVIAVQCGDLNFEKATVKIIDLIQKYIPYHILLFLHCSSGFIVNVASKKISLNDSNKRTIEKSFTSEFIPYSETLPNQTMFVSSLAFSNVSKLDLKTVFESYSKSITLLHTAQVTGEFADRPIERSKVDVNYLERIKKLETEIFALQNQAKKETQLSTQIQINTEVQNKRTEIETIITKLKL